LHFHLLLAVPLPSFKPFADRVLPQGAFRFFSSFHGSVFKRNFVSVARANVLALVLPIAALPLLSRLFGPADFSVLAMFSAVVAVLLSFATWRFDWLLPNARSMFVAANVLAAGTLILVGFSLVLTLALVVLPEALLNSRALADLGNMVWLLPFALLSGGVRQLLAGWYVRTGDLRLVGRATIAQSTSNVAFSIGAGLASLGGFGLIASFIAATWTGVLVLAANIARGLRNSLRLVSARTVVLAAGRYRSSATWSTLVSVSNAASLNAPVVVLAFFYAPQQVGWYALVNRMVAAPVGAMSSALGQSFWAHAAEFARGHDYASLRASYLKMTLRLALASISLCVVCLAAPFFVGPLLGAEEWTGAGYVMLAMTPLFLGGLVFSPTGHLVVLNRQHLQLLSDGVRLILVLAGIGSAAFLDLGFIVAVFLASLGSLLGHLTLFILHLKAHDALIGKCRVHPNDNLHRQRQC